MRNIPGWDRYNTAKEELEKADVDFDVDDCFKVLKDVAQVICPTVVSMVYDITDRKIYWCENREWKNIRQRSFEERQ